MAKVITNKETNPHFLEAAGKYLEANGYTRSEAACFSRTIFFYKEGKGVAILNDNADFVYYEKANPEVSLPVFRRYMALTSIGGLDIFKWKLLFHIADLVPIKPALLSGTPTIDPVSQIFAHFNLLNRKAIPTAY
jgi:hypothetical protein